VKSAVLLQLRAGEITFDDFAKQARRDIKALAASLINRWQVPPSISAEDVEQEMLLAAWQAVRKWDPSRASIAGFVVFSMCDKAKKLINRERAALRRDGGAPSRHAVPLSSLTEDGTIPEFAKTLWSEDERGDSPFPRERILARVALNRVRFELQCAHPEHDRAIAALFDSGLERDRAARVLYSDPDAAVPSLGMAKRLVKHAAALCGLDQP
jgi:DNA-directed RNA polymerase specialized sigma24 family protein